MKIIDRCFIKHQFYLATFILFFLTVPNKVQSQNKTDQIVGAWVLNYEASIELMSDKAKAHYDKMAAERQEKVKQAYRNRKITFEANGNFTQEFEDGRIAYGTWNLNNNNFIEIHSPKGSSSTFKIKELNKTILLISRIKTGDNKMNMLIANWYLTRD